MPLFFAEQGLISIFIQNMCIYIYIKSKKKVKFIFFINDINRLIYIHSRRKY